MNIEKENAIHLILDSYRLNTPVRIACFPDKSVQALYNFDSGGIEICDNRMINSNDFVSSVLHEVNHALMADRYGREEFYDMYMEESDDLDSSNLDSYWDNRYEVQAENFARKELSKWSHLKII